MNINEITASSDNTLNGSEIRLLNWNIQKLNKRGWLEDLQGFGAEVDLALIQEASLEAGFLESLKHVQGKSFVKGYSRNGKTTGVMTFSRVTPQFEHQLLTLEPFLRTPKATSLSQYAIAGHHESLLVINLHAVNFSWGLQAYKEQLKPLICRVNAHRGPVILAGDFNAWRQKRQTLVRDMADHLLMSEVGFGIDQRKKVFGNHLDYIFTRGLNTLSAETFKVRSSDHNPMLASFSL